MVESKPINRKNKEYLTIIIYDISSNKIRNKVCKLLDSYGKRVQKSSYECWLNIINIKKLLEELTKLIQPDDSVIVYRIDGNDFVYTIGKSIDSKIDDFIIL
jgi:CRISPR-associated protein Cas2